MMDAPEGPRCCWRHHAGCQLRVQRRSKYRPRPWALAAGLSTQITRCLAPAVHQCKRCTPALHRDHNAIPRSPGGLQGLAGFKSQHRCLHGPFVCRHTPRQRTPCARRWVRVCRGCLLAHSEDVVYLAGCSVLHGNLRLASQAHHVHQITAACMECIGAAGSAVPYSCVQQVHLGIWQSWVLIL